MQLVRAPAQVRVVLFDKVPSDFILGDLGVSAVSSSAGGRGGDIGVLRAKGTRGRIGVVQVRVSLLLGRRRVMVSRRGIVAVDRESSVVGGHDSIRLVRRSRWLGIGESQVKARVVRKGNTVIRDG